MTWKEWILIVFFVMWHIKNFFNSLPSYMSIVFFLSWNFSRFQKFLLINSEITAKLFFYVFWSCYLFKIKKIKLTYVEVKLNILSLLGIIQGYPDETQILHRIRKLHFHKLNVVSIYEEGENKRDKGFSFRPNKALCYF